MFLAFDAAGKKALAFAELQQAIGSVRASDMGRKRFLRYLLRQKRREHVLLRFFRTSFTTVAAQFTASLTGRPHPAAARPTRAL